MSAITTSYWAEDQAYIYVEYNVVVWPETAARKSPAVGSW
jgi:hypothetical protein